MHLAVRFAGVLLALFVAGCVPSSLDDTVESIPTRTFVQIQAQSAGPLTPDTAYSASAIKAKMPGFTTETITAGVESSTVAAYGVFSDGIQVLQVHKGANGRIGPVHGVTHHLSGPNGERIGQTYGELRIDRDDCRVGRDLWRGMALCQARGADNVTLVFAIPQFQGPFDRLAPDGELDDAVLQRIVWEPR